MHMRQTSGQIIAIDPQFKKNAALQLLLFISHSRMSYQ